MKPTSWKSIPRVFFRFATIGKVEKTCFERYWRDFVNLAFCTACKSPTKIVIWNRLRGIRSQGCFFDSPDGESRINEFWTQSDDLRQPGFFRCLGKPTKNGGMKPKLVNSIPRVILRFAVMAKVEKRVLNAIGRPSSTRRFSLLGKAHPKWWYETSLVEFDPKGVFFVSPRWGKTKKRVFNPIGRTLSTRLFAVLAKARRKWWYETEIGKFDSKGDSSFRRNGESRKNEFWTELDDLCQPGFLRCLQKPTQNGFMKSKLVKSIPRVFLRFASMGKVEKTRFERIWTTFVNPAFCAAWNSPPKMVV